MAYTIRAELRPGGHAAIEPGDIYERRLFTAAELASLLPEWRIRPGVIRDFQHFGTEVVEFISRREGGGKCVVCGAQCDEAGVCLQAKTVEVERHRRHL